MKRGRAGSPTPRARRSRPPCEIGERPAAPVEIDLRDVAEAARERWLAAPGGELEVTKNGVPALVHAARADLDRVADVLVENALAYAPAGSGVRIDVEPGRLAVLDEGPGPAPGEEEQVFERFHRGSAGRAGPAGTGLGLAIARALTRRWGGDVRLERRPEGGAAALVELP
jgi:signal transduction histidine kinase